MRQWRIRQHGDRPRLRGDAPLADTRQGWMIGMRARPPPRLLRSQMHIAMDRTGYHSVSVARRQPDAARRAGRGAGERDSTASAIGRRIRVARLPARGYMATRVSW